MKNLYFLQGILACFAFLNLMWCIYTILTGQGSIAFAIMSSANVLSLFSSVAFLEEEA